MIDDYLALEIEFGRLSGIANRSDEDERHLLYIETAMAKLLIPCEDQAL